MTRDGFLAMVGTTRWSAYSGAYGPDYPLGNYLSDLISSDSGTVEQCLAAVLGHVCHQDVLEESAPPAARVMLAALDVPGLEHSELVLTGLLDLLRAGWTAPLPFCSLPRTVEMNVLGSDLASDAAYDACSDAVMDVLREGNETLLRCLRESRGPALTAWLLAIVAPPGQAATVARLLLDLAQEMPDPLLLAGFAFDLALLTGKTSKDYEDARKLALISTAGSHELERVLGVAALLFLDPEMAAATHAEAIEMALRMQPFVRTVFPWADGHPAALVAEALMRSSLPDGAVAEHLMTALEQRAAMRAETPQPLESGTRMAIATRLTERAFREHIGRSDFITARDLSETQRGLLRRLLPLAPPVLAAYPFGFCGLRNLWRDARRLLGEEHGGLDATLGGAWAGRPVTWPVWKWLHQARILDRGSANRTAEDYVVSRIGRWMTASQIWEAAKDAADGPYQVQVGLLLPLIEERASQLREEILSYGREIAAGANCAAPALFVLPFLRLWQRVPDLADSPAVLLVPLALSMLPQIQPAQLLNYARSLDNQLHASDPHWHRLATQ
jgi:hypothetical protein